MLEALLRRLRDDKPEKPDDARERAVAVLLLEVARADFDHDPLELQAIRKALGTEFGLDGDTLDALLSNAQQESKAAISLHDYVQTLNRTMQPEDKRRLMQQLWQVAYADGKVDPLEEHTLRRLADLLHVPHHEYIRGKLAGERTR